MVSHKKGEEFGEVYETKVAYFSDDIRDHYKVYVNKEGKLVNYQGKPLDFQMGNFTMDGSGEIYYFEKGINGIIHHSSPLRGEAAGSAGMLSIDDGVLKVINNQSGHYDYPPDELFNQFIDELKDRGANLGEMQRQNFSHW